MTGLTPALSAASYRAGVLGVLVVVVAVGFGGWWARAALLPFWRGAPARLAEIVVAIAIVVGAAQFLGTFGWFRAGPMLATTTVTGFAIGLAGMGRVRTRHSAFIPLYEPVHSPPLEVVVAVIVGTFVAVQWVMHVAVAYGRGITQGDSLWYHASYAAHFVESGRITGFYDNGGSGLTQPLFIPLNGSLVQATVMLPFHRDLLSPLVNVGWAALTLLAAVCLGRRHGTSALMALAAFVLLAAPTISGTQPGQAANDIATVALFLAAIALLFEGELARAPTALAGVAAGLAFATKPTVALPVVALSIGLLIVAALGRQMIAALLWCLGVVVFGGFWTVRNWVVYGNPAPWITVHLGPFTFTRTFRLTNGNVELLHHWSAWKTWIFPGFSTSLGRGWWVVLLLALGGAVAAIARGRGLLRRIAGAAVIAGIVALAFVPTGSDFAGAVFVFMVRYLAPVLLLGLVLLVELLGDARAWMRRTVMFVFVAVAAVGATTTYPDAITAWPSWEVPAGMVAGLVVLAGVAVFVFTRGRARVVAAVVGGIAIVVVSVGAGWSLQKHYFEHRYVDAGLTYDELNAWFQPVHGAKVGVFGDEHFYPLFGTDLSNDVLRHLPDKGAGRPGCRDWIKQLSADHYDYIVVGRSAFSSGVPQQEWLSSERALTVAFTSPNATVYAVHGALDATRCA